MTDTTNRLVPEGSYILNYGARKMFPEMEKVAEKFNADSDDMENGVAVSLTNEELYIPPDGVKAIGVDMLEFMNEKPKEGAHSAIDKLLAMNTLRSLKPMYGGGEVKPMNYAGGGLLKKKMMGYENGGAVDYLSNYIPDLGDGMTGFQQIVQAPKEGGGFSYYLGDAQGPNIKQNQRLARKLAIEKMQNAPQDSIPANLVDSYFQQQDEGEDRKKGGLMKLLGFKGMQNGGEVMLPSQPKDPLQIGARQADPSMYQGQTLGVPGEMEALRQSIMQDEMVKKQAVENKAKKSLQLLRLIGVFDNAERIDSPNGVVPAPMDKKTFKGRSIGRMIEPMPYYSK